MTPLQVQFLVTAHIQAHTAGKGRPTYIRIGRKIAEKVVDDDGFCSIDSDNIPIVVEDLQDNHSIMACYGEVPNGAG